MSERPLAAIVLAAGKGTRMKSDLHKVLHPIAGRPMLAHLLETVEALGAERTVVVVGSRGEQVEPLVQAHGGIVVVQEPQLGTAHAVQQAEAELAGFDGDVLILYGDTPFVTEGTMRRMRERLDEADAPAVVVVASRPADPKHYGRILARADGTIDKMVEYKDATEQEREIDLCNSGLMAVRSADLWPLLARVGSDNAAGEHYLPDIVMLAAADGRRSAVIEVEADEVEGINSRAELAQAEARWQTARRRQAMDDGVTLVAPDTVWFAWDTELGRDVIVEPNVIFEPGVRIGDRVRIESNAIIAENTQIGPGEVVSGPTRFSVQRSRAIHSATWTGQFSTSDRSRMVIEFGPVVIDHLWVVIRELELRSHNLPPEMVEEEDHGDLLADLRTLRARLDELIRDMEWGEEEARRLDGLAEFYQSRIAPWFEARLQEAGRSANNILSASPVLIAAYVGLSQLLDSAAFVAFMSGAISGILSRPGARGRN